MNQVQETFSEIRQVLQNYDKSLGLVIEQSELDFVNAYQQHMMKIERELENLKRKAKEQDLKINQDSRILHLESQIVLFKSEFDRLIKVKGRNHVELERLRTDC